MRDISKDDSLEEAAQRLRGMLTEMGRRRSLRDPIAGTIEEMGLTGPQFHAILFLGSDGALTMGDLARRVGCTEKTITGVVDRLERDKLVQRERDAADRRVVRVRLTRAGTTMYRRVDKQIQDQLRRVLGKLDAQDRADLFRILNNLLSRIGSDRPNAESAATKTKEGQPE